MQELKKSEMVIEGALIVVFAPPVAKSWTAGDGAVYRWSEFRALSADRNVYTLRVADDVPALQQDKTYRCTLHVATEGKARVTVVAAAEVTK